MYQIYNGSFLNTSHFPLNDTVWSVMKKIAILKNPDFEYKIEDLFKMKDSPMKKLYPNKPIFKKTLTIKENLLRVQNFMNELQYNYTGTQFFPIDKFKTFSQLMKVAKEILDVSLPIKCLEAIVLAIYLTNSFDDIQRFTIGFVSYINGEEHRHIVLGIYANKMFGSIGLSRRPELMYKPLEYESLYELLEDFEKCYEKNNHILITSHISSIISQNVHCIDVINWQLLSINHIRMSKATIMKNLEHYCRYIFHQSVTTYGTQKKERLLK